MVLTFDEPCGACRGAAVLEDHQGHGSVCPTCNGSGFAHPMLRGTTEDGWPRLAPATPRQIHRTIASGFLCEHVGLEGNLEPLAKLLAAFEALVRSIEGPARP